VNGTADILVAGAGPAGLALDARTKELIALAIAVCKECDGCIAAHAHAAVRHGATPAGHEHEIGQPNGHQHVG
jgi:AhpD family alkylhydroperoxidase